MRKALLPFGLGLSWLLAACNPPADQQNPMPPPLTAAASPATVSPLTNFGPDATQGGAGGDVVTVLDEPSFENAYLNRSGPRIVRLGAMITLTKRHVIKGPFLTIDGQGIGGFRKDALLSDHHLVVGSTHDVHVTRARFYGGWAPGTTGGLRNTGCFTVDGDTNPQPPDWDSQPAQRRFRRVRIDYNWFEGCADSGFDIWGGGERLTSAFNVHYKSFHPQTISGNSNVNAYSGGEDYKTDILLFGNLYAQSGERLPKIKFVHNLDYVGNFIFHPTSYTSQDGTPQAALGVTLDCDGNGGPSLSSFGHNVYGNFFIPDPQYQLRWQQAICGCDADPLDCSSVRLYYANNMVIPPTVVPVCRDFNGGVPHVRTWTVPSLGPSEILALIGPPNRTRAENDLYAAVAAALQ